MRLRFELNAIEIDPVCHIQINRHAEEYHNKNVTGLLYGALYEDKAHITNILPFPQSQQMQTREDTIIMQKRHDEKISDFQMDDENLGFYYISFGEDYWEELENVKLYEDYKNTSFFMVYDYQARVLGKNPYKGFRLSDNFFEILNSKNWANLKEVVSEKISPLEQIPVYIQKNEIFELLMLYNRKNFLKKFNTHKEATKKQNNIMSTQIDDYIGILNEHQQNLKKIAETKKKSEAPDVEAEKVPDDCFYQSIAVELKACKKERELQKYQRNLQELKSRLS